MQVLRIAMILKISIYPNTNKIRPKASSFYLGYSGSQHLTSELIAHSFEPSFFLNGKIASKNGIIEQIN